MTDRELLDELRRDLDNRWMRAERDGYGSQREPEKQQSAALQRLRDAVDRLISVEDEWDSARRYGDQRTRNSAGALADAKSELRRLLS